MDGPVITTIDVTDATFETEVVQRSMTTPVIVDLWAEWCGPCKTLGPILEKVVAEYNGNIVLAKVDVDSNPQVGQAFKVQSIPAVYAMKDGTVVDGFMGAQPEAQIREFIEKIAPPTGESEIDLLVSAGDETSLRRALEIDPNYPPAIHGLGHILVEAGNGEEALQLLERIPETLETRHIAALARSGDVDDVEGRLSALLDHVKGDDEKRQEFLDLLELLGPEHPETAEFRRQLSARLF